MSATLSTLNPPAVPAAVPAPALPAVDAPAAGHEDHARGVLPLQARRRALSLGAKDFVVKPFDIVEVTLRISNLLETRILYERLRQSVTDG
jgi:CheY-like chemotaxis protein